MNNDIKNKLKLIKSGLRYIEDGLNNAEQTSNKIFATHTGKLVKIVLNDCVRKPLESLKKDFEEFERFFE